MGDVELKSTGISGANITLTNILDEGFVPSDIRFSNYQTFVNGNRLVAVKDGVVKGPYELNKRD